MSSQEAFLARVRRALHHEPLPPAARSPLLFDEPQLEHDAMALQAKLRPQRHTLKTQLLEQLSDVGGIVACMSSVAEATAYIIRVAQEKGASSVVRWQSDMLQTLEVDSALHQHGITVHTAAPPVDNLHDNTASAMAVAETRQALRGVLSEADMGLSGVDWVIAETGTLVVSALPGQMRGVSLLPPVHIAVARAEQIVATLADYLLLLRAASGADLQHHLTSCVSFITGPSRTGDIELTLSVGVHGPAELHLVVLDTPDAS
jgi:L-lactate dehydrogenase complex protein LldG